MTTATRWLTTLLLGTLLVACSGDDGGSTPDDTPDAAPAGHALSMRVTLTAEDGKLAFLTPQGAITELPLGDVVGKPYWVGSFPAGFSPGNDPPLHQVWGVIGDDLKIDFATPATYADGPYDMIVVIWTTSVITEAMKNGTESPPNLKGDLAGFTLSMEAVREGDPQISAGSLRANVEGADAVVTLANKADPADVANSFNDTILFVP